MIENDSIEPPLLPTGFEYRPDLAWAATSKELKLAPRHRWFYFPHSYSHRLVDQLLDHFTLPLGATVADTFVGSGTTLLCSRARGVASVGVDISPLAVTVANAKLAAFSIDSLCNTMKTVIASRSAKAPPVPERLCKAFTGSELDEIYRLLRPIGQLRGSTRLFFIVALIWTARSFSRAVPDGGWFRWREWPDRSDEMGSAFRNCVQSMIADVLDFNWSARVPFAQAQLADARRLPFATDSVDALITSPPYANRHDYSRVFHVDLLLLGMAEMEIKQLRYSSVRSHVEARHPSAHFEMLKQYRPPELLTNTLGELPSDADPRIERLLLGYFEDLYLCLLEVRRVLRRGGQAAFVIGNVRHAGVMIPVDEILAEIAPQSGLEFCSAWVLRYRGNSAQQMGQYGRSPARESIVLLSQPSDIRCLW